MNSAFPDKKNLTQKWSSFMTNKFESNCLQKFYMKTTSYLEELNRHFCQHFTRRMTQQTFLAINLASQQKTTKLVFSSQIRKQFKLLVVPFKSFRCCLRSDKLVNCQVWKIYKDLFLNFRLFSWPDLSIESYFSLVSSLILLRSLRVYKLKQLLFFSISVNSGFSNTYLATSWLGKYSFTRGQETFNC